LTAGRATRRRLCIFLARAHKKRVWRHEWHVASKITVPGLRSGHRWAGADGVRAGMRVSQERAGAHAPARSCARLLSARKHGVRPTPLPPRPGRGLAPGRLVIP